MTARAPIAGAVPRALAVALGAALALSACSLAPSDPAAPPDDVSPFASEADYRQRRAETAEALEAAVRTEARSVGACRVVATSEQACGGPTSFAVYSAQASDAGEVERLAARLVALDKRANEQFRFVSTCVGYVPPVPVVQGGRCVAGP